MEISCEKLHSSEAAEKRCTFQEVSAALSTGLSQNPETEYGSKTSNQAAGRYREGLRQEALSSNRGLLSRSTDLICKSTDKERGKRCGSVE